MRDESMRRKGVDEPRRGVSRRWFLQGAVAAVGATGFAFGQKTPTVTDGKPILPDGTTVTDCGCVNEAALPVIAAARVGERYYGYVGTDSGPRVFSLAVDSSGVISLADPVKLEVPEGFVFGSIGAGRGGLVLSGGLPFVIETLDVDYELTEDVRVAMDSSIPEGIPTSGRQRVDIMGVRPAAFLIDQPASGELSLPAMPKRSFAVATAIAETTQGGVALLIEHSDGVNESRYASAVDVIEESGSGWKTWNAGRNLGESGPNFLAGGGEVLVAGINTAEGSFLSGAEARSSASNNRILALVPEIDGATALVEDRTGNFVWSSVSAEGRLVAGPLAEIENDEIVGAAAVGGANGQVILLGRRSAKLEENIPALLGRAKGGASHVM